MGLEEFWDVFSLCVSLLDFLGNDIKTQHLFCLFPVCMNVDMSVPLLFLIFKVHGEDKCHRKTIAFSLIAYCDHPISAFWPPVHVHAFIFLKTFFVPSILIRTVKVE